MLCWLVITQTGYEFSAGLPRMPLLHSLLLPATVRRKGSRDRTVKTLLSATSACVVLFGFVVFFFLILQWRNEDKKTAGKGFPPHMEEQDAGRCLQQTPLCSVPISVAIKPQVYNKTSRNFRKLMCRSNHMAFFSSTFLPWRAWINNEAGTA